MASRRGRQCGQKVRYWSRKEAKAALRRIKGTGGDTGEGRLQAYICDYCNYFHLGHIARAIKQQRQS